MVFSEKFISYLTKYEYFDDIYDKVQRLMKSVIFAIFILCKDMGVGGWSRQWQFSLTLCSENVLTYRWVGGSKKTQDTLT